MNNASTNPTAETLKSLRAGDIVTVSSDGIRKPRKLVVTKDAFEREGGHIIVYVSSGKPWGGRGVSGGLLELWPALDGETVRYQPTLMQRAVAVSDLTRTVAALA